MVRYLPWFQMWDPWVTRELTIRDIAGAPQRARARRRRPAGGPSRPTHGDRLPKRLRFIRPETSFRSAYAYDNALDPVAGEVIEAVTGQAWEAFVGARVLARARGWRRATCAIRTLALAATSPRRMPASNTARCGLFDRS